MMSENQHAHSVQAYNYAVLYVYYNSKRFLCAQCQAQICPAGKPLLSLDYPNSRTRQLLYAFVNKTNLNSLRNVQATKLQQSTLNGMAAGWGV